MAKWCRNYEYRWNTWCTIFVTVHRKYVIFRATFSSFHLFWHSFYLFITAIKTPWQELAVHVTRGCWRWLHDSWQLLGLIRGSLVCREQGWGRGGEGRVTAREMERKSRGGDSKRLARLKGLFIYMLVSCFYWEQLGVEVFGVVWCEARRGFNWKLI